MKQTSWFKRGKEAFGGDLLTTRAERARRRPLSTTHTMHLVLRSSQAKGDWSFRKHAAVINRLLRKYADKFGVRIISFANVGNHLHLQVKLSNRHVYPAFIRALTGGIALAITGANKFRKLSQRFWDRRPYTRIVIGYRAIRILRDYIGINTLEGAGWEREQAEFHIHCVSSG